MNYLCGKQKTQIKTMFLDFLFRRHREALPLPYKRELHCHIVPGVDDGSPEQHFSLEYLQDLSQFGVEKIIFTPHHTFPNFLNTSERIEPIFTELKAEAARQGIGVELEDFSFEYRLDESFLQMMECGKWGDANCPFRPLKGRYLLIENSFAQPLINLDDVCYKLQEQGWYLIMAHPERYHYYARRGMNAYEHLQNLGVEFQCNILSFAGYYGETVQKAAFRLLEEGMVNFLGSDLHNKHHADLIRKYLATKDYASVREELEQNIMNDKI